MDNQKSVVIEMYYSLTCPNCKVLKRMLEEVLPQFESAFKFKTTLANSPVGMFKTMQLGINSVPALLINNEIVYKGVPSKDELISKLKTYL